MFNSNSDTTSPTPTSPFSSYSVPSEPTSDEVPDLGAFTTVLREWGHLQPPPRTTALHNQQYHLAAITNTNSGQSSDLDQEVEVDFSDILPEGSTVWAHRPIASYLQPHDRDQDTISDIDVEVNPTTLPPAFLDIDSGLDTYQSYTETPRRTHTRFHSPNPTRLTTHGIDVDSGGSNTEGQADARAIEIEDLSDIEGPEGNPDDIEDQPSLGYLDEALNFIAAERARHAASREAGFSGSAAGGALESPYRHVVEPKRKRRRKRAKTYQLLRKETTAETEETVSTSAAAEGEGDERDDAEEELQDADADGDDDSSSSLDQYHDHNDSSTTNYDSNYHKSSPATPARTRRGQKQRKGTLSHSQSFPTLRPSAPIDPRLLKFYALANKLRSLFPEDTDSLRNVLTAADQSPIESTGHIDPRGPPPGENDTLIHVFIDHSNILIGLLTYLKRYPLSRPRNKSRSKHKHLSHSALALILERGRAITRRVLVTSSPLYQPMETATELGYEVRVYARVPDMGDGPDRDRNGRAGNSNTNNNGGNGNSVNGSGAGGGVGSGSDLNNSTSRKRWKSPSKGHSRKVSGSTSTESDASGFPKAFIRSLGGTGGGGIFQNQNVNNTGPGAGTGTGNSTPAGGRIRYREQGVDELLQLKLHQALADIDVPPPNATIVLATGDGNVGQFNEDGFLGPVRTALKKGWKVELYAWKEGLSRAWMREFGEGEWKDQFKIVGMEQFGEELLEDYSDV